MELEQYDGLEKVLRDPFCQKHHPHTLRFLQQLIDEGDGDGLSRLSDWLGKLDKNFWDIRHAGPLKDEERVELLLAISAEILYDTEEAREAFREILR